MTTIQTRNNPMAAWVLLSLRYSITYFAFGILTGTILTCAFFILFTIINFTAGDLTLLGYDKFGFMNNSQTYDESDVIRFFSIMSLMAMIVKMGLSKLIKLVIKRDVLIKPKLKYFIGLGFITFLMICAQFSIFFPNAAPGSNKAWPYLLVFWIISLVGYSIHSAIMSAVDKFLITN